MSSSLVLVFAIAAIAPLVAVRLRLPGALLEIIAGIVLGPSVLGWVRPDTTISAFALLGLSFLLFLAGSEVDLRRFRGTLGRRVAASLAISLLASACVVAVLAALGVGGAVVIGVALLATSLGLVVPVLADAGALARPIGRIAVAGASAGEVAAVVLLSVGLAEGDTPLAGRILLLVLLLAGLAAIGVAVVGVEHSMPLTALVARLADTSAQIRVRWTVLAVAGLALAAQALGFEAILGAFLAGMLVRALDPDPEHTHPHYPIKLEAVGYGLLVPVFFVTSGLTLDLRGLSNTRSRWRPCPRSCSRCCSCVGCPRSRSAASSADASCWRWRCCRRPRCRSSSPPPPSAARWVCSTRPPPPVWSRRGWCRCSCSRPSRWPSCPASRCRCRRESD